MIRTTACLCILGDEMQAVRDEVAVETPLALFVNGRHFCTAMLSPELLREFVVGHLLVHGMIECLSDVVSLEVDGNEARVLTQHDLIPPPGASGLIVSGCGGGSSFLSRERLPQITAVPAADREHIHRAVREILDSETHRRTGGVHTVGLFPDDGSSRIVEDIGRHNALDKAIGIGLIEELREGFVACTGRISSDMVLKCTTANIPLIVSQGAATSLAVDIAERTGVSVVAFVRGQRMNVCSNWERLHWIDTHGS